MVCRDAVGSCGRWARCARGARRGPIGWTRTDSGDSDRFDALQVGFEVGRSLGGFAGHRANAFLGAGLDVVRPFGAEDVLLQAPLLCAGAGYRYEPGGGRSWFLSLDYRREWIGARNERATHLFGDAWSLRAGLGWIFGAQDRDRLRRLQG